MNITTEDNIRDSPSPPKKKKHKKRKALNGRLKKLWRRATTQTKGITSRKEWLELVELHSTWKSSTDDVDNPMMGPLPGPAVTSGSLTRDYSAHDNWQNTEGSDHRDIILNLLFRQSYMDGGDDGTPRKKKRKRDSSAAIQSSVINIPPLPSWASVYNLAGVGGLAVIEINIEDRDPGSPCPLMPSERIKERNNDAKTASWTSLFVKSDVGTLENTCNTDSTVQRNITACKVNLFQGNKHPRSLSDVLMFLPPPVAAQSKNHDTNKQYDVIESLYELRLSPKQLQSEGYPCIVAQGDSSINTDSRVRSKICAYSKSKVHDINMDDAIELVKAVSVEVSFGDDNMVNASNNEELEHYVKTFSRAKGSSRRPKVYSVDCEMVSTSAGMELARVSVIEFVGAAGEGGDDAEEKSIDVLDELVNPRRSVMDYLTQFSGITPKMLLNVNMRIEVIQLFLLSIIHEDDIIVAHSGENDLKALRLVHNNIVDTSVIFRGDNGRKYSLKHLSNVLLQKQIQSSSAGHCSKEDAEAALVLALRRARRGTSFRLKEAAKPINVIEVFQKAKKIGVDGNSGSGDETSFAERNDRSCVCIGPNEWLRGQSQSAGSQHLLCCESLSSSMSMAIPSWLASKKSSRAGLMWAKLVCGSGGLQHEMKKQDEIIDSLVTSVPRDTVFLIIFQRNLNSTIALTRQRKAATNPKAACIWSDAQEEEWRQYMTCTRNCEALWIGNI